MEKIYISKFYYKSYVAYYKSYVIFKILIWMNPVFCPLPSFFAHMGYPSPQQTGVGGLCRWVNV